MMEIGVKGAILTPYYANLTTPDYTGPKVFDIIGWDAKMVVPEEDQPEKAIPINRDNPSPDDIKMIYQAARKAQTDIKDWPLKKRLEFIRNLKAVIIRRQEYILDRLQAD